MMLLRLDKYISLVATNAREYPNETLIPVFDILLCIWTGQLNMRWFLQTFHPSVKYVVASYLNYKDIETLNMRFNYTDSLWRYNYRESYQVCVTLSLKLGFIQGGLIAFSIASLSSQSIFHWTS
ncbi:hypothetical protein BKA69DRAFT_1055794 [Paraphysoderma sedebokerense]|nr:hypothetical protein BKA69DRAFT_1055794 [Paraphysoderma sedebokerense]